MNLYIKNGIIKNRNQIVVNTDKSQIYNPTEETLFKNGWEIYTPPVSEIKLPPIEEQCKQRIVDFIRQKYSIDDELAIQRQRYAKPEEFEQYNQFVESCKQKAYNELNGDVNI